MYARKKPHLAPNVAGTITAVSTIGTSFSVEWTDEENVHHRTQVHPSELIVTDPTLHEVHTDETMTWADVKQHMREFTNDVQQRWKNTRALREEVRADSCDYDERLTCDELEGMDLPDRSTVSAQAYGEAVLTQMLDRKFMLHLRMCAQSLQATPQTPVEAENNLEFLMKYLVTELDFEDFMGVSSSWQHSRLQHPSLTYPKVIEAMTGKPHVCRECVLSENCMPEHLCCYEYHVSCMTKMGWWHRTAIGKIVDTPPDGSVADGSGKLSDSTKDLQRTPAVVVSPSKFRRLRTPGMKTLCDPKATTRNISPRQSIKFQLPSSPVKQNTDTSGEGEARGRTRNDKVTSGEPCSGAFNNEGSVLAAMEHVQDHGGWGWRENSCHYDSFLIAELAAWIRVPLRLSKYTLSSTPATARALDVICSLPMKSALEARDAEWKTAIEEAPLRCRLENYGQRDDAISHVHGLVELDAKSEAMKADRTLQFTRRAKCVNCHAESSENVHVPFVLVKDTWHPTPSSKERMTSLQESLNRQLCQQDVCGSYCPKCECNGLQYDPPKNTLRLPRLLVVATAHTGVDLQWGPTSKLGKANYSLCAVLYCNRTHYQCSFMGKDKAWRLYDDRRGDHARRRCTYLSKRRGHCRAKLQGSCVVLRRHIHHRRGPGEGHACLQQSDSQWIPTNCDRR